jgi:molecular chaperone GrpE (heat shock protein)
MPWLKRLLSGAKEPPREDNDERTLAGERGAQELRLLLAERERELAQVKGELERRRGGQPAEVEAAVRARLERFFEDAAAPAAQLLTQAHLMKAEGKPVAAKDVLLVATRMVRALEDHGLVFESAVGETVPFDAERHAALSAAVSLKAGEPVVVRVVGVVYGGKRIRKAGVERCRDG